MHLCAGNLSNSKTSHQCLTHPTADYGIIDVNYQSTCYFCIEYIKSHICLNAAISLSFEKST